VSTLEDTEIFIEGDIPQAIDNLVLYDFVGLEVICASGMATDSSADLGGISTGYNNIT